MAPPWFSTCEVRSKTWTPHTERLPRRLPSRLEQLIRKLEQAQPARPRNELYFPATTLAYFSCEVRIQSLTESPLHAAAGEK